MVLARNEEGEYRQLPPGQLGGSVHIPSFQSMDEVAPEALAYVQGLELYDPSMLSLLAGSLLPIALLATGIVMLRRGKPSISMKKEPGPSNLPEGENGDSRSSSGEP